MFGVDPRALLAFSAVSVAGLYALLRLPKLPLTLGFPGVAPDQAVNTLASFATNTHWQSYSSESTMGHLAQMAGFAFQNFASAAVGIAVAVALIRGFTRSRTDRVGNFWVDLTRGCLRILLPLAVVATIALVVLGAVQNFSSGVDVTTLTGSTRSSRAGRLPPRKPSSRLSTNGGGFYNANSAHLRGRKKMLTRAFPVADRGSPLWNQLAVVQGKLDTGFPPTADQYEVALVPTRRATSRSHPQRG